MAKTKMLVWGLGLGMLLMGGALAQDSTRAASLRVSPPAEFVIKLSPEKLSDLLQVLQSSDLSFRVINGLLVDLQTQAKAQLGTASTGDKK